MKKGFTLIELLAIIAIIGVVAFIVFPSVMDSIKNSRQKLYDIQIRDIEKAAEKWSIDHIEYMDNTHLNTIGISLNDLVASSYLQKNNILDPRYKTQMNGCIKISYNDGMNQYEYHYEEVNCDQAVENGFVYAYIDNNWEKTEQNVIISASNKIIAEYIKRGLIKSPGQTGSGFYDEGDRYIFRGDVVDNYVKLSGGNEIYRILSIDKNKGTMRLIGTTPIPNAWDSEGGIVFENATVSTVQLDSYYNNSSNGILENVGKIETNALWNVGIIEKKESYEVLKSLETDKKAYAKIGLPSITDFVGASANLDCHASSSDTCKEQKIGRASCRERV